MFSFLNDRKWKSNCAKGQLPAEVCEYLELNGQPLSGKTPVEELRFFVLDTETTGLDIKKDHLLSIGAIGVHGNMIHVNDSFEGVIQNDMEAVRDTIHIHGILPSESARGIPEDRMLLEFLKYASRSIFVAHNVGFDRAMIDEALKRNFGARVLNPVIDTMDLARRFESREFGPGEVNAGRYSLDSLAESYGIDAHDRHTAWGDAMITARLLVVYLSAARARGIRTLADLRRKPNNL